MKCFGALVMAILFALISHLASYEPIISAGSWSRERKKKEKRKKKKKGRKKGFYFGRRQMYRFL